MYNILLEDIAAAVEEGEGNQIIAKKYGVCHSTISEIRQGNNWANVEAAKSTSRIYRRPIR